MLLPAAFRRWGRTRTERSRSARSSSGPANPVTTAPCAFIATRAPTTFAPPTVVPTTGTSSVSPIVFAAFDGTSAPTIAMSSFAAQKTPRYGLPAISSLRSSHSLLRERDLHELVLELDHANADPMGRVSDASPPKLLVDEGVDPNVLRLRFHVPHDVLPDRLHGARSPLRAGDRANDPQRDDQDSLLFLGHRFTS